MKKLLPLSLITLLLALLFVACSKDDENPTNEEGEEDGTEYGISDTCDQMKSGTRLLLFYNSSTTTFEGSVENTTNETISMVRIEVHLSNGTELGPTTPADLAPGESRPIELFNDAPDFEKWSAHAEVGEEH
jgi:hypothetical protein